MYMDLAARKHGRLTNMPNLVNEGIEDEHSSALDHAYAHTGRAHTCSLHNPIAAADASSRLSIIALSHKHYVLALTSFWNRRPVFFEELFRATYY